MRITATIPHACIANKRLFGGIFFSGKRTREEKVAVDHVTKGLRNHVRFALHKGICPVPLGCLVVERLVMVGTVPLLFALFQQSQSSLEIMYFRTDFSLNPTMEPASVAASFTFICIH